MARIVGCHRLALKPGVDAAKFEAAMKTDVFPGVGIVAQANKAISHGFTKGHWLSARHDLLRSGDAAAPSYVWLISATCDADAVAMPDGRAAVEKEACEIIDEFLTLGSNEASIASVKIAPFAERQGSESWVELSHHGG